jgi:hypothetical protein
MKPQSLMVGLTVVNALMLTLLLVRPQVSEAQAQPGLLRGTGLQIVDQHGKVRASIALHPADPSVKMPDGSTGYPETVLLRLIDSGGRPSVKIEASDAGAGMALTAAKGPAYMNVIVKTDRPVMKLVSDQGRENQLTP